MVSWLNPTTVSLLSEGINTFALRLGKFSMASLRIFLATLRPSASWNSMCIAPSILAFGEVVMSFVW